MPTYDKFPAAYHITFTCYGSRLHGGDPESVDRNHNIAGTEFIAPEPGFQKFNRAQMKQLAYVMDKQRRVIALQTIKEVSEFREWELLAVHVLSKHIHIVIVAQCEPEKILKDMKSYISRRLNEAGFDPPSRRRWTRHGSTRYKWNDRDVITAIEYVVRGQEDQMEVFERQ